MKSYIVQGECSRTIVIMPSIAMLGLGLDDRSADWRI